MMAVATGQLPMGAESVANNQMYQKQYARAGRWIDYYYADQCGSGSWYMRVLCGMLSLVALGVSGCVVSSDTRAGRDLADTVEVEGYRKLYDQNKAETTLLYFVGPSGGDLSRVVSARNFSPEPPTADLPETGSYRRVVEGYANSDEHACRVVVSTLLPGNEPSSTQLSEQERQDVADGKLTYVRVACFCAGAP